jgi:hypothetical protein
MTDREGQAVSQFAGYGQMCVQASCLAHRRRVFTGGIDHDWLHTDRTICSIAAWPVLAGKGGSDGR